MNISGWFLDLEGVVERTWRLPDTDLEIEVGAHVYYAAKTSGCFPEPDAVIEDFTLPYGDAFELTLRDADERLMEPIGDEDAPPFAGGYDGVVSRSMERVEIMFGGRGTEPQMWHFYTPYEVDVPNNDRVKEDCRSLTHASPGRANSPDYSGAMSVGGFE